jgi:hypothetical protein
MRGEWQPGAKIVNRSGDTRSLVECFSLNMIWIVEVDGERVEMKYEELRDRWFLVLEERTSVTYQGAISVIVAQLHPEDFLYYVKAKSRAQKELLISITPDFEVPVNVWTEGFSATFNFTDENPNCKVVWAVNL